MLRRETIAETRKRKTPASDSLTPSCSKSGKRKRQLDPLQRSSTVVQIPSPLPLKRKWSTVPEVISLLDSPAPPDPSQQPPTKRRRRSRSQGTHYRRPPEFWDNLSRLQLTRLALHEFDRRTILPTVSKPPELFEVKEIRVKELARFARRGGPNLRDLRGYAELGAASIGRMSSRNPRSTNSISKESRKESGADPSITSSEGVRRSSPYDPDFEQKYIDSGIYPYGYVYPDDCYPPIPNNIEEINERLRQPRPSLSPSKFTQQHFLNFQRANMTARDESQVMSNVFPIINGTSSIPSLQNRAFGNLETMTDGTTTNPQPDYYEGSSPSQLDPRVRAELGPSIVPSKWTSEPLLANNFVEVKGPNGNGRVLKLQAMQDAAHGARGMLAIQSHGQDGYTYDGNAYTMASTYHSDTGSLHIYTMHPIEPAESTGRPQYHMNLLNGFSMIGNMDTFVQSVQWLRNARDYAKDQRDAAIAHANATENATIVDAPATIPADQYLKRPQGDFCKGQDDSDGAGLSHRSSRCILQ